MSSIFEQDLSMLEVMSTYADRLALALTHAQISRVAFSKAIGISPQATALVLSGQTKALTAENTAHAARALRVNHYWLATGEGSMAEAMSPEASEAARLMDSVAPERRAQLLAMLVQMVDFATAPAPAPEPSSTPVLALPR